MWWRNIGGQGRERRQGVGWRYEGVSNLIRFPSAVLFASLCYSSKWWLYAVNRAMLRFDSGMI
jgi:hypothetical protein